LVFVDGLHVAGWIKTVPVSMPAGMALRELFNVNAFGEN
jgi:hypothetical protein